MFRFTSPRFIGVRLSLLALVAACAPDEAPTSPAPQTQRPIANAPAQGRLRVEGYPTTGDIRQGWVLGRDGRPMHVTYEVHNGNAIWQGDIVLGRADEISTTEAGAKPFMRLDHGVAARLGRQAQPGVIIDGDGFRWPGGVMPYLYDPALPDQARIQQAITMIESTTGGITIVPKTAAHMDWIKIVPDAGCSSKVGRQGGEQVIFLADDCGAGSLAHEMLHALGSFHEQSRCDRDNYVEIQFDNVEDDKKNNFDKHCDDATDYSAYDFGSLMHYPLDAFSKNGQNTIKLRPGVTYDGTIGQRSMLGSTDIIGMNQNYGLNNKAPVPIICTLGNDYKEGANVFLDGRCSTDEDDKVLTYEWKFGDGTCAVFVKPVICTEPNPTKVYANDGVYTLALFVFDSYKLEVTEELITIKNVAPSFTLNPFSDIDEGAFVSRFVNFTDPGADTWTASVDYGDGNSNPDLDTSGKSVSFGQIYKDNSPPGSPFQVKLSITDDDETTTVTRPLTVNNVAPRAYAGTDVTVESGQTFDFMGSFSDPGVLDSPWNWRIEWGVAPAETGSTTTQGAITSSLMMCAAGTFDVTLSVKDKDGDTGSDQVSVTVGYVNVGLDITPGSTPNAVSLKKKGSLPVAILSSATFDATTIDPASVRLGDESGTDTGVERLRGRYNTGVSDVNGDGRPDLVLTFSVPQLVDNRDLIPTSTSLVIRGSQGASGGSCVNFRGTDAVVVVSS